ncbi:MAG: GNAT family N-acetyltransferase [Saprospiraceae bacterium]
MHHEQVEIVQLKSKRILLRTYLEADKMYFLKGLKLDGHLLAPYFSKMIGRIKNLDEVGKYFSEKQDAWKEKSAFTFGIFHNETGKLIGQISIRNIDWSVPKGELGFFVFSEFSGQGYGSEALQLMVKWCKFKHGFERIFAIIGPENKSSIQAVLKSGFLKEGVLRKSYKKAGKELMDMEIYAWVRD